MSFGIQAPVASNMIQVNKLGINGATSGRYFEYPQLTSGQNDSLFCNQDFASKCIAKLEACIGVGIYSIRVTYVDGTISPLFGTRQPNVEDLIGMD